MPRVVHTPVAAPGTQNYTGAALTQLAADTVNKEEVVITGKELVLAQNSDVGAHTVTITSVADNLGRTKDIAAVSLAAGELRIFGPFGLEGWRQSDGFLYFEANHATIKFSVLRLP
jgi:hypothetical protein